VENLPTDPCPLCGSGAVEDGRLMNSSLQPLRATRRAKLQTAAEIRAHVCLDCGHVFGLYADVARVREMLGEV